MCEVRVDLGDPQWELIDPTPNAHALFLQFDVKFFSGRLRASAVAVRWSKRMYSCAGICRYEGKSGMCEVALSEPLLKLRPRKDLVETLLHEMIHAYLFVAESSRDREGHGPNFQRHMHRINAAANLNISIYHSFHDEVRLYQTHWWRCNGPCQARKPYFGIVRRTCNRAPGASDFWWATHQTMCGGQFVKFKEPEKKQKPVTKPRESITKYVNVTSNINNLRNSTAVNKNNAISAAGTDKKSKVETGARVDANQNTLEKVSHEVVMAVRNHWANKYLNKAPMNEIIRSAKSNKRTAVEDIANGASTPPSKLKKIDHYFPSKTNPPNNFTKNEAESMLQDIYGENFTLYQTNENNIATPPKIIALGTSGPSSNNVECPSCKRSVPDSKINQHLDTCLSSGDNDNIIDLTDSVEPSQACPVCNQTISGSLEDHLEVCLKGFENENNSPDDSSSTSSSGKNIVDSISLINDDSDIDETRSHNETGTMHPCPCCLAMVEAALMNRHIDECLTRMYLDNIVVDD